MSPHLLHTLHPNLTCDPPQTVKRNQQQYDLLTQDFFSSHELYGWTMDRVVSSI